MDVFPDNIYGVELGIVSSRMIFTEQFWITEIFYDTIGLFIYNVILNYCLYIMSPSKLRWSKVITVNSNSSHYTQLLYCISKMKNIKQYTVKW